MLNVLKLKLMSALEKLLPGAEPRARELFLSGLQGERVSFQVAYLHPAKSGWKWGNLEVEAAGVALGVTLRQVHHMPGHMAKHYQTDANYLSRESGLFPDLLTPIDPAQLPQMPGVWQCLWVDIVCPQAVGEFPLAVTIQGEDGEVLAAESTTLTVVAGELPPLRIPRTMWFHGDCLAQYHEVEVFSPAHWEILENFIRYAVQHGMNTLLTPIHTPPLDTAVGGERTTIQLIDVWEESPGRYGFGFTKLEKWVEICKAAGVEYYEMAHLFTQWGAKHAPKIVDTVGKKLFGWETDAAEGAYPEYLRQMLPALVAKLRELGVAGQTFFHISDEPSLRDLENYRAAHQIVAPLLEGFRIIDAISDYDFYKEGLIQNPVCATNHLAPFLAEGTEGLWCYHCCVQSRLVPNHFFMQPSARNRILGVLLYKYNMAGFLHWGYNFYNSVHSLHPVNPFVVTDASGAFPSGDPFVVYPGPGGRPQGSIRLMVAQDGFDDYRALCLLEGMIGRAAVLEMIGEMTFEDYPQDGAWLLDFRRRVNQRIGAGE